MNLAAPRAFTTVLSAATALALAIMVLVVTVARGSTEPVAKAKAKAKAPPAGAHPTPTEHPAIPNRPAGALGGDRFIHAVWSQIEGERDAVTLREASSGNVPELWRHLVAVPLRMMHKGRVVHSGVVWVTPDYLEIGSDDDHIRMPMNPMTAQKIADKFGFLLPTRKLVDEIYRHADIKLRPSPMTASPQMASSRYYLLHNQRIDKALGKHPRGLIAGHKKDVVISNKLDRQKGRVAIYGWHRSVGKPIQPLSTVHKITYADYSHGIRLVFHTMLVDGVERSLESILRDPNLSALVSDEGPIRHAHIDLSASP